MMESNVCSSGERQASEECMRIDRKVVMVGDDMKVQGRH